MIMKTHNNNKKKKKNNTTFLPNSSSSSASSPSTTTTTTTTTISSSKPNQQPFQRSPRKSYYFTRDLTTKEPNSHSHPQSVSSESPRRSSSRQARLRKRRPTSRNHQNHLPATSSPEYSSSEEEYSGGRDRNLKTTTKTTGFCACHERENCEENDTDVIDDVSLLKKSKDLDSLERPELPRIATKPKKKEKSVGSISNNNNNNSPGIRLRINNSPRIANRKIRKSVSSSSSKSLSESFAVVKSSFDPQTDFRESMVEMIVENNIRASKDLEDLLACYLSLNSDEYHGLIIKVFKQIWFDLTDISN